LEQVGDRHALLGAAADQLAEGRALRLTERLVERQVEVHARAAQHVREEQLRVEPRLRHLVLLEEVRRPADELQCGPLLRGAHAWASWSCSASRVVATASISSSSSPSITRSSWCSVTCAR